MNTQQCQIEGILQKYLWNEVRRIMMMKRVILIIITTVAFENLFIVKQGTYRDNHTQKYV